MRMLFRIFRQQMKRYPGPYAFLCLLISLTAAIWIAEPLYASYAINTMLKAQDGEQVNYKFLFAMWLLLFFVISAVQTTQKFWGWKLTEWLILDYREKIYGHVMRLGISFHTRQKSGEIVKILDNAADTLADLQRELLIQLIPSFISAIVFLIIGFTISPILSLVLICSIILYLCIALVGTRKTAKLQQQVNKLWVESIGRAFDAVTNVFSVKSGSQEEAELGRMERVHELTYQKQQQVNKRWAMVEAINFFMLTRILLTAIGFYLFTQDVLSLGFVYFFQASFFRVLTPFEMLGSLLPQWNKQVGRVRLAEELLAIQIDVVNKPNPVKIENMKGEIEFKNVHFAYLPEKQLTEDDESALPPAFPELARTEPEEQEPSDIKPIAQESESEEPESAPEADPSIREVLHDMTLTIKPGEHVALVGHSGAGKSTVAMLLNRFYDVTEGKITVDGHDMRDLDVHWWRSQIGLVLQDNLMFNDTVMENIRYARPEATDEEVRDAARRAAADEFIEAMPMKYKTLIGDRGIRLSGGQRQRVAIARAILKKPSIIILDEATSALDSVTERQVQEGIKELIKGRTSVIIAHRLSTVRSVDRIAVMENGRVTAFAPHDELMKTSANYKQMVELQREGMLAE
jgi:ABC-type multidrug transport system fused ATPase/permease subunit